MPPRLLFPWEGVEGVGSRLFGLDNGQGFGRGRIIDPNHRNSEWFGKGTGWTHAKVGQFLREGEETHQIVRFVRIPVSQQNQRGCNARPSFTTVIIDTVR